MRVLLFLAAATALAAQQPAEPQLTIRTTTRLVQLDIVVRDSHGPVANLAERDFAVFDNGRLQKVAFFERVSQSRAAVPTPAPAPAPAIVVLDDLNSFAADQLRAKPRVTEFLRGLAPEGRVAVFRLGRSVRLAPEFSATFLAPSAPDSEIARLASAVDASFVSNNPPTDTAVRVRATCVGLIALSKYLGRIPGRKNLLWVTAAFPLLDHPSRPSDSLAFFADEVSQLSHAAADANVAIYGIDVRGLVYNEAAIFHAPVPSLGRGPVMMAPAVGAAPLPKAPGASEPPGIDSMNFIAHGTGGRTLANSNDIGRLLRSAAADSDARYILGFYPDSSTLDGRRHILKVDVARKGLDVRYRRGYTASADDPAALVPERAQIAEALSGPVDSEGIGLRATVEKADPLVRLRLTIAGTDIALRHDPSGWSAELALVYSERTADGRDLGRISDTLNLQYDDAHYRNLAADGVAYDRLVHPAPEATTIRVIVYDRASGRLGSVTVPL